MPFPIKHSLFKAISFGLLVSISIWPAAMSLVRTDKADQWGINEQILASVITEDVINKKLPSTIAIPGFQISEPLTVNYTIDEELEAKAHNLLKRYNPDYGVFVAINPDNGHILSMVDSARDGMNHGNLSLSNTFPAASVSKIITTVAALNEEKANKNTIIPFNGKTTTLYKKHVFKHQNNKYTKHLTLTESFAKSVNSAFGRLGAVHLGGRTMLDYAHRLGFNGQFSSDFRFDNGRIKVNTTDSWEVAEMSTGYTRNNTLSPLHAAVIAATAVNGGKLIAPVLISSVIGPHGIPVYQYDEPASSSVMTASTSRQLKDMMQATVKQGSARKSFRQLQKGVLKDVRIGGKTGSLTGFHPKGKYDWFVGFAENQQQKIAYAVLCINKEKWYVKSAQLARQVLEYYFERDRKELASF
ncbi:MAG: hypothetical protein GKR96_05860 [Gammaproteobacteria bacterium]|nr:hypothetical protein [Gammaproteobacteria bacterium]